MSERNENSSKKKEKEMVPAKPQRKSKPLAPYGPSEMWEDFDRAFERIRREFENIYWPSRRFFVREFPPLRRFERMPSVDVEDLGKELRLTADLPGFRKEEVEVHVEDDAVEISGRKSLSREEEKKGYVRKERQAESFYRRIRLPSPVKAEEAQANLKDGVLELTLPKKTPTTRKKIQVK